jgi:hypothetical protein
MSDWNDGVGCQDAWQADALLAAVLLWTRFTADARMAQAYVAHVLWHYMYVAPSPSWARQLHFAAALLRHEPRPGFAQLRLRFVVAHAVPSMDAADRCRPLLELLDADSGRRLWASLPNGIDAPTSTLLSAPMYVVVVVVCVFVSYRNLDQSIVLIRHVAINRFLLLSIHHLFSMELSLFVFDFIALTHTFFFTKKNNPALIVANDTYRCGRWQSENIDANPLRMVKITLAQTATIILCAACVGIIRLLSMAHRSY